MNDLIRSLLDQNGERISQPARRLRDPIARARWVPAKAKSAIPMGSTGLGMTGQSDVRFRQTCEWKRTEANLPNPVGRLRPIANPKVDPRRVHDGPRVDLAGASQLSDLDPEATYQSSACG
ncbi:hypothetical protein GCM10008965_11780 [Methylorubrum aminovorans]|nr:hypothetical protein GCM10025880_59740 [Methylorubrum aminovorans]